MVRYSKNMLLTSFLLALFIFLAGLLLGFALDSYRSKNILTDLKVNDLDTESYLVEQIFFDVFGGDNCELIHPRINDQSVKLRKLGSTLTEYEQKNMFEDEEYTYLKMKYSVLQIKTYALFSELKNKCYFNSTIILFFYDKDHELSERQGYVLDALVNSNNNIHVFAVDRTLDNVPILDTVEIHYNITSSPTLIINNRVKKDGFVSLSELKKLVKEI